LQEKKMSHKKDKAPHIKSEAEMNAEESAAQETGPATGAAAMAAPNIDEVQKQLAEIQSKADVLQQQLTEAQAQAAEYKDGWQRALADFQNYKRRTDAERDSTYQNAVGNIIKRYLPVLDDMERAMAARPADLPWSDGIELIYRKLQTILENEGLKRIDAEGQPFDPNFHEAISQEPADGVESGHVIGVVQNGYMLGERVIRPALVRVAQ
jgi:molecular chaperone GrpE